MNLVSIFENSYGASTVKPILSMPICMNKLIIKKKELIYVIYLLNCNAYIYLFIDLLWTGPTENYITLGAWEFMNNISILIRPEYGDL
jgi:hypothetical protein